MNISHYKKYIILIGTVLLSCLLVLYQIFFTDFSFTMLSQNINESVFRNTKPILQKQKIQGIVHANHNNLGMVAVRFLISDPDKVDYIIFRLKDRGGSQILNEQRIRSTFINNKLFNFGFNPIVDSKNKEYIIELESETGNSANAVSISNTLPHVALRYKYAKSDLFKHLSVLEEFITSKIKYKLAEPEIIYSILLSLFPILFFLLKDKSSILHSLIIVVTVVDIFLLQEVHNILLFVFSIYLFAISVRKGNILTFVMYSCTYLSFGAIIYYLRLIDISTKLIYWSFLFLIIGIAVNIFQLRQKYIK